METTIAVRERPILFSGPMVRALLDGRKTQTRRVVKLNPAYVERWQNEPAEMWARECPYGRPGDRLWVRECAWYPPDRDAAMGVQFCAEASDADRMEAARTLRPLGWRHRPSIHMPRAASRLVLELTDVRVERLQDISIDDVLAEGVERDDDEANGGQYWREATGARFAALWDGLNAERDYGWDVNPWVWVLTFRRVAEAASHA